MTFPRMQRRTIRFVWPLALAIIVIAMGSLAFAGPPPAAPGDPDASQAAPTCIALVLPSVRGADGSATDVGSSLRELFASYLTGPSIAPILLDARLQSQAIEEARQKSCQYILVTTMTRKRDSGSGVGRALGQAAGQAAWYGIPYGGGAGAAAARGVAIAGAHAVSTMATTTKAKDELTLEYKVGTLDDIARASMRSDKAKARTDGEDLLTPLVEKAAEAIVAGLPKS